MDIEFGIGYTVQHAMIPDRNFAGSLHANPTEADLSGADELRRALAKPIGTPRIGNIVRQGEKIAIVTSDITRPCPSHVIIPVLLEELEASGVDPDDITVVFGLGSHRRQTEEEHRRLVSDEVYDRIKCVDSNINDVVHIGTTSAGTPVDIDRTVASADRRICIGNIEYHYFAGYSGGAKAIMPGVSTPAAIQCNHRFMTKEDARTGIIDGNPVREDIEEAGAMTGIDFIINVVLDENKNIVRAFCGDSVMAHREGCRFLDSMYKVSISEPADIVIVSQGGAPKDLNLYQLQKALDNARHAVRQGGIIILVGSCREGLGNARFEEWMTGHGSPAEMVSHIAEDFQLGGHKAAAIAQVMLKADVYLVSEMEEEQAKRMFFTPFCHVQEALDAAMSELGEDSKVLAITHGGSVLPVVENN